MRGGGLRVTGNPTLTGSNVTFYFTGDSKYPYGGATMHGGETVTLSAPTTGDLAGILFFQDRSMPTTSPGSTFGGPGGAGYTGALYFPTTSITYKGHSSILSTSTLIVAYTLYFKGNAAISNYTFLPGSGGPIHGATLAE
jgi:hypothetical protein